MNNGRWLRRFHLRRAVRINHQTTGLGTLFIWLNFKPHALAHLQRTYVGGRQCCRRNKDICSALIRCNETKPFALIVEFDDTFDHLNPSELCAFRWTVLPALGGSTRWCNHILLELCTPRDARLRTGRSG